MEVTITVASHDEAMVLFGLGDRNLKLLRDAFEVDLTARGETLRVTGGEGPVAKVSGLLRGLITRHREGMKIPPDYLEREIDKLLEHWSPDSDGDGSGDNRSAGSAKLSSASRNVVEGVARSKGQSEYMQSILQNDIVFCVGPAGTGKTFLAVRLAVHLLREGEIRRLILCRPAVEAGEKLGFLPGDFQAKINPYLRPLYDALNDILDYEQVKRYMEREILEIVPLAYMRGRTLNNAFIILDEGQNTTVSQMKMFLTRMGASSKIVVNGDVTQVDLPPGHQSGLSHAGRIIGGIKGIGWVELKKRDIVRHPLVKKIVAAYETDLMERDERDQRDESDERGERDATNPTDQDAVDRGGRGDKGEGRPRPAPSLAAQGASTAPTDSVTDGQEAT